MHATFHAGDVDAPRGAVDPADLNVDSVLGSIGYMATRTMPWFLSVYGILSTVARPSAASPNAPTPAVRAACARALRFLNHNTTLGVTYKQSTARTARTARTEAVGGRFFFG